MDEEELTDEEIEDVPDEADEDLAVDDDLGDDLEEVTLPTLTYRVVNGHIAGMVDDQDAMVQAIDKILKTDRFSYSIYSEDYGNDFVELFGKEFDYAEIEIERMLTEALQADDRVTDVTVDSIEQVGKESLLVTATATTVFSPIEFETEVSIE